MTSPHSHILKLSRDQPWSIRKHNKDPPKFQEIPGTVQGSRDKGQMYSLIPLKGFPDSSVGKESTCNAGDPGSIPGSGRSSGEGIGYPLQYSWASLMAQLVKNLPSQCRRPGFDPWVWDIPWRRERLPTPVFWPGEFHVIYSPWGRKESDTTELLSHTT